MNKEKKLLKILEQFKSQLSGEEIAFIDNLAEKGESIKEAWDTVDSDYHLFTDGAAEFDDNYKPINAAIGGLLKKGDKVIFSFAENIGSGRTNNEAEYLALIKGVQECIEHKIDDVNIYADSELVVNQVNGKYKLKDSKMIKLHGKVVKLCSKLQSWNISHIVREKNTEADDLSKKGLKKIKR